jgi:hypothetical protein
MLKWARKAPTVALFFTLIHQEPPPERQSILAEKIYLKLEKPKSAQHAASAYHYGKQEQFMLETQKLFRFADEESELDMKNYDINPSPSWIYGIRYRDVRQFVDYLSSREEELIFYYIGKVAIIFSVRSHRQRHYLGHQYEIICLATIGLLCATA